MADGTCCLKMVKRIVKKKNKTDPIFMCLLHAKWLITLLWKNVKRPLLGLVAQGNVFLPVMEKITYILKGKRKTFDSIGEQFIHYWSVWSATRSWGREENNPFLNFIYLFYFSSVYFFFICTFSLFSYGNVLSIMLFHIFLMFVYLSYYCWKKPLSDHGHW